MADSPYKGLSEGAWLKKTQELIAAHPLKMEEIQAIVLQAWADIFQSKLGPKKFQIGKHIFPKPQIMGFFLHELISLELAARYPKTWRGEQNANDKDVVHISENRFSIEIKTSSHKSQIFGNRSYAQEVVGVGKKSKSGYYLTVNFGKFSSVNKSPQILQIRFGWLDHSDWIGQTAQSGQQAHLTVAADKYKLLTIYSAEQSLLRLGNSARLK
jgi:hypothetical protein